MTLRSSRLLRIMLLPLFLTVVLLFEACSALNTQEIESSPESLYQGGMSYYQLGLLQQARESWQQGLAITKETTAENQGQARFLNGLARVAESSGDYQLAVKLTSQSLQLEEQGLHKRFLAEAHLIKGQALWRMGSYKQARYHLELAENAARDLGNLSLESGSVRTLGSLYQAQGHYQQAEEHFRKALSLGLRSEDQWMQAKALNNLGGLYRRMGKYQEALDYYTQSLQLRIKLNDQAGQGKVLGNLCLLYQNFNDQEQALDYCQRALKIARKIKDKAREANHLNNYAYLYRSTGELEQAKKYFFESLKIKRELPDPYGEAHALNNIADIYRVEGQHEDALKFFSDSLAIKIRLDDMSGQSATYFNIGLIYYDLGQFDKSLEYMHRCLALQKQLNEPELLWQVYDRLSRVYQKTQNPRTAVFFSKHAVNTIQRIRSNFQNLRKHMQKTYLKNKRSAYEQLANLLIDKGRFLEAQQVLDMVKEEEYFDFIRRRSGSDPRITQSEYTENELDWETRYLNLSSDLVALGLVYQDLKQAEKIQQTIEGQDRIKALKGYLKKAKYVFREFLNELEQSFKHEGELHRLVEKDLNKFKQYQQILGRFENNPVLIHYLLTDEKVRILLTSKNNSIPPVLKDTPITRAELNQLIFSFREKISQRQDVREEAEVLYDFLISPIEGELKRLKADTLVIFSDQSLRYIPFAVLSSDDGYLIERFALSMYTVKTSTHMLTQDPKETWKVAGFGVSKSLDNEFENLPAVDEEINSIVLETSDDENEPPDSKGVLRGRSFMNSSFTAQQLEDATGQDFQVFHLATHFKFIPGSLKDSFLLAGNGERINLEEFYDGFYDFARADLVALSACETALNGIDADGVEVEGLGAALHEAGANAILASLWKVADRSTAMFMEKFYRFKLKNLGKAEALRQTQLWFIKENQDVGGSQNDRGQILLGGAAPHRRFSHPYYWAPFILMGNWL